ncbi:MAG: hypothetical protein R6U17_10105 [Thermoplasmata archaeon]
MMVRRAQFSLITIIVVLISTLVLSSSGISQDHVMEEGDVWAMGGETHVDEFFFPGLTLDFDDIVKGYEHKDIFLEDEAGYYQVIRLVEVDEEGYKFKITAGGGIHSKIDHHVVGDVMSPGEHHEDNFTVERKELTGEGEAHFTHDLNMDAVFDKNLSLLSLEIYSQWNYRGRYKGTNVSFLEYHDDNASVYYEDVDLRFNGNKMYSLYFELHEPLDVFNMDLEDEARISSNVSAILEGYRGGVLNVRGLPEEEEKKILNTFNSTEFPVYWEDIANDGIIEETEVQVLSEFSVGGWESIKLEDDRNVQARPTEFFFEISNVDRLPSIYGTWWYSPESGFVVSQEISSTDILANMIDVTGEETIRMMPTSEETASQGMRDLQYIPPLTPVDTLLKAPYAYVIMLVLITVALIAYYHRYYKRDK